MNRFLIYGLVDPRDGQLRYVGKTKNKLAKRLNEHLVDPAHNYRTHWLSSLKAQNLVPNAVILQEFTEPEILCDAEIFWIAYFRKMGCPLTNLTDGGEGTMGRKVSIETRAKIGSSNKGKVRSPELFAKMSAIRKGKKKGAMSTVTRKKLSIAHKKRPVIDQNGTVYESISEVCRTLGLHIGNVYKVLKGWRSHTGGYKLRYGDDVT